MFDPPPSLPDDPKVFPANAHWGLQYSGPIDIHASSRFCAGSRESSVLPHAVSALVGWFTVAPFVPRHHIMVDLRRKKLRRIGDARLKKNTRAIYMKGLARFLMMVKSVDGCDVDCDNILINVFRSELFQKLQELPILSDTYSPTRQTVLALCHFAVMSKLRLQAEGDSNGAQMIDRVINGHLKAKRCKRCTAAQKEASTKKYIDDALLMLLFKATACVITALYTNAPPTRSMKWQSLLDQTITDSVAVEDMDWFAVSKYKTFKTYGNGGKWIHASNRRAIVLYRELLDTKPELRTGVAPEDLLCFQKQTYIRAFLSQVF